MTQGLSALKRPKREKFKFAKNFKNKIGYVSELLST